MGSFVYRALLRLHPRAFRERFGPEMVDIFEQEHRTKRRAGLLIDAFISAVRQRTFAPASQKQMPVAGPAQLIAVPVFQTLEGGLPSRSSLVNGAIITVVLLSVVNFTAARGGGSARNLLIGGISSRPYVLPVKPSPVARNEVRSQVEVSSPAVNPADRKADNYFRAMEVLRELDGDGNGIVSALEITGAASTLARLDSNGDGGLDPQECGTLKASMHTHPTLSVLDADGDLTISAREIQGAPAALRTLDINRDGMLTPAEVHP